MIVPAADDDGKARKSPLWFATCLARLSARLATAEKRFWPSCPRLRLSKKFKKRHSEAACQLVQKIHRGISPPVLKLAEAALAAAHANVDAARTAFLPQISLTGSGGFLSAAVGTLVQGSNFGYAYGTNLLQTIFDGGKLIAQKRLAEATEKEYIARYRTAAYNAYADVETALIDVENTGKEQQHLVREVEAAREAFKISQLQYRQGVADLLTILQAQQTLFSAEDQLVQAMQANRQASVQLFEALGGGWTENPDEQTQFPVQNYTRQTAEGH